MTIIKGQLYIVATPIGNLEDITFRAVETLKTTDLIAAEDTRHTRRLLERYGIQTHLVSLHQYNEHHRVADLLRRIEQGASIAVVSDAGTPLISDPGFDLVRAAASAGINVIPVPGPSAVTAALSVSGLPINQFSFFGFLPKNRSARKKLLLSLLEHPETLVFFESCHRIEDCLADCVETFPADRQVVIAREISKSHESILRTTVGELSGLVTQQPYLTKGELVLMLQGADASAAARSVRAEHIAMLEIVLQECSVKKTAELVSKITGVSRSLLYSAALELVQKQN